MNLKAEETKTTGVYQIKQHGKTSIATRNMAPGSAVYGERLLEDDGIEYRVWNPHRSKLGAFLTMGGAIPISSSSNVLYLGAATGTTASHVSDIVHEGMVYALELSAEPMRKLLEVSRKRKNMVPILGDAARPETYMSLVDKGIDLIYQDVAQRNQAEIAIKNAATFLGSGGATIIAIKARSIDATVAPKKAIQQEVEKLEKAFDIDRVKGLSPFHKDHAIVVGTALQ